MHVFCARRKPVQLDFLVKNSFLERNELRRRLDPNLVDEVVPQALEGAERLSLTAGAIERHHQLSPESLPEWVLGYRCLTQCDDVRIIAECQPGIEPGFRRGQSQILQPDDFRCRPSRPSDIEERRSTPKIQGTLQNVLSSAPISSAHRILSGARCQLKCGHIKLAFLHHHRVAAAKTDDPIGSERTAEERNVARQRRTRSGLRLRVPKILGKEVSRDHLVA